MVFSLRITHKRYYSSLVKILMLAAICWTVMSLPVLLAGEWYVLLVPLHYTLSCLEFHMHARLFLIVKVACHFCVCEWIHLVKADLYCCISSQVVQDWKFVAQVLDRVFLWVFLSVSVLGSALLFIPVIYKWAKIIVPNYGDNSS